MNKKELYTALGVKETATFEEIKHAYRELAKKYHPDVNKGDKKAEARFVEIAIAYSVLSDAVQRGHYDRTGKTAPTGPTILTTKTGKYNILRQAFVGDVADIYETVKLDSGTPAAVHNFALKIARSFKDNDLLENEAKTLKEIYPSDKSLATKLHLYLPKLIDSLKIDDGTRRQANILEWLSDYYPLETVRSAHPKLQLEHGVWMFNRILEILGYVHGIKNYVHGAIIPSHVLVYAGTRGKDPLNHGARLVGWSYSVPVGQTIRAIDSKYESFYPPEVFKKKPATAATDIYMAAKSIIYTIGGEVSATGADRYPTHIPDYFINFLRSCTIKTQASRPQDAWQLHKELKEHMRAHYGPKKYVPFHMPLPA